MLDVLLSVTNKTIKVSVAFSFCYAECHYVQCRHAECRGTILDTPVFKASLKIFKIRKKLKVIARASRFETPNGLG
jgi:hypothetical protein